MLGSEPHSVQSGAHSRINVHIVGADNVFGGRRVLWNISKQNAKFPLTLEEVWDGGIFNVSLEYHLENSGLIRVLVKDLPEASTLIQEPDVR